LGNLGLLVGLLVLKAHLSHTQPQVFYFQVELVVPAEQILPVAALILPHHKRPNIKFFQQLLGVQGK
jgi:NADH:ubiquinone oxidoreductase subunit K